MSTPGLLRLQRDDNCILIPGDNVVVDSPVCVFKYDVLGRPGATNMAAEF